MLMIIAILIVVGLCLGSFVNALVWRVHEQAAEASKKKPDKKHLGRLSIAHGRSMCPYCRHELGGKDLVPVLSWLVLKGRCRYCGKAISAQYPLVELATTALFVASYLWWPNEFGGTQDILFVLWLLLLVGLLALAIYDLRWRLLPSRLIYPLSLIAVLQAVITISAAARPLTALLNCVLAVAIGGGIFYFIFQVSKGKWIGGGDVRLGFLLGLVAGTPARSFLIIYLAALLGTLVSVPLLLTKRAQRNSTIPFGPFLILAAVIAQLFGHNILSWYHTTFLGVY